MLLPKAARPAFEVITISGRVMDEKGNPLEAGILWENLETGETLGLLHSNPDDGSYFIALPQGAKYGYFAEIPGYYSESKNLDLRATTNRFDIRNDIVMTSIKTMIKEGTRIRINNIFFDVNEATLRHESYRELERMSKVLRQNPGFRVEIEGHTDDQGDAGYNLKLSQSRADAVVRYLIKKGVEKSKLLARGYGESRPVKEGNSEKARQKKPQGRISFS